MSKKKVSKIPKFESLEEEARFWDAHEFAEFEDELEEVAVVVELQRPKEETLILRVQKSLKDRLNTAAKKRGLTTSSLARMWLAERLGSC